MNTAHKQARFVDDDGEHELMRLAHDTVVPDDFFQDPNSKPCRNCGEIWPHGPAACSNRTK